MHTYVTNGGVSISQSYFLNGRNALTFVERQRKTISTVIQKPKPTLLFPHYTVGRESMVGYMPMGYAILFPWISSSRTAKCQQPQAIYVCNHSEHIRVAYYLSINPLPSLHQPKSVRAQCFYIHLSLAIINPLLCTVYVGIHNSK